MLGRTNLRNFHPSRKRHLRYLPGICSWCVCVRSQMEVVNSSLLLIPVDVIFSLHVIQCWRERLRNPLKHYFFIKKSYIILESEYREVFTLVNYSLWIRPSYKITIRLLFRHGDFASKRCIRFFVIFVFFVASILLKFCIHEFVSKGVYLFLYLDRMLNCIVLMYGMGS